MSQLAHLKQRLHEAILRRSWLCNSRDHMGRQLRRYVRHNTDVAKKLKRFRKRRHLEAARVRPPLGTSDEAHKYLQSLHVGDIVVECEPSNCLFGTTGIVYESDAGHGLCAMWKTPDGKMGTSLTWGTRRLIDVENLLCI